MRRAGVEEETVRVNNWRIPRRCAATRSPALAGETGQSAGHSRHTRLVPQNRHALGIHGTDASVSPQSLNSGTTTRTAGYSSTCRRKTSDRFNASCGLQLDGQLFESVPGSQGWLRCGERRYGPQRSSHDNCIASWQACVCLGRTDRPHRLAVRMRTPLVPARPPAALKPGHAACRCQLRSRSNAIAEIAKPDRNRNGDDAVCRGLGQQKTVNLDVVRSKPLQQTPGQLSNLRPSIRLSSSIARPAVVSLETLQRSREDGLGLGWYVLPDRLCCTGIQTVREEGNSTHSGRHDQHPIVRDILAQRPAILALLIKLVGNDMKIERICPPYDLRQRRDKAVQALFGCPTFMIRTPR